MAVGSGVPVGTDVPAAMTVGGAFGAGIASVDVAFGVPVLDQVEPMLLASPFLFVFALSTAQQLWVRRWHYLDVLLNGN